MKTVWISTPPRTGSTWLFNVAREVLRAAGHAVMPERVPQEKERMFDLAQREAWQDRDPRRVWVLKVHGVILRRDLPLSRIITAMRDPRDQLVSYRRFMNCPFEDALAVSEACRHYDDYADYPPDLLLDVAYRDITGCPEQVVRQVAAFLDVPLAPGDDQRIASSLSRDEVRQLISRADQDVFDRLRRNAAVARDEVVVIGDSVARAYDVGTAFQTGHVSDYRDGDWRHILTDDEKRRVKEALGDWLERHGFEPD